MKKTYFAGIFIGLLLLIYILNSNRQITFEKVKEFTEIYKEEDLIVEYYVLLKQPSSITEFKKLINNFIVSHKQNKNYMSHTIVILKEHDFDFMDKNDSYLKSPPREINEIDLLCKISRSQDFKGQNNIIIHYYEGSGWYYGE